MGGPGNKLTLRSALYVLSCVKAREVRQNFPLASGKIHCTHDGACRRETVASSETLEVRAGRLSSTFRAHSVPWVAARTAPNGVKDRASFCLVFGSLNTTSSHRKFSMVCRRAKFTRGNINFQKEFSLANNFAITTHGPAQNEVQNASFARRSAHRNSRLWRPELIDLATQISLSRL